MSFRMDCWRKTTFELIKGEATAVNRVDKIVTMADGETIKYEKLIFATGSRPMVPPIPGVDKKNVYTVKKEFNYLCEINEAMKSVKDLVIIGGGFIGVEFADECRKGRDINITLVEALPHCLQAAMDDEFCVEAESKLSETGVKILVNSQVKAILGDDKVSGVRLVGGTEIKADMVILAIGALPNTQLAKEAGLQLGYKDAIKTNRYMQTYTDPDIFACGDCAENTVSSQVHLCPPCWPPSRPPKRALPVPTCIHPFTKTLGQSASSRR